MNLSARSISGARWQGIAQLLEVALGTIALIILARGVSPDLYGIVALGIIATTTAALLLITPFQSALIALRMDSRSAWDSLMTFAVAPSLLVYLISVPIVVAADLPSDQLLVWLVVGASLPLTGFASIGVGVLQQGLGFRSSGVVRATAALVGNGVPICLAFGGNAFLGLALRVPLVPLVQFLGAVAFIRWVPRPRLDRGLFREAFSYIKGIAGFNIINQASRKGDDLLVALVLGPVSLGVYSLAYRNLELAVSQVGQLARSVMFPTLVRIDDNARFAAAYIRGQRCLVWAAMPAAILMVALGKTATPIIFGSQWAPAGSLVQIFGAVAAIQIISTQTGTIYTARLATGLMLRVGLITTPVLLLGVLGGVFYGARGAALGYLCACLILFLPVQKIAGNLVGLSLREMLGGLKLQLVLALLFTGLGSLAVSQTHNPGVVGVALLATVLACGYWAACVGVSSELRSDVSSLLLSRKAPSESID